MLLSNCPYSTLNGKHWSFLNSQNSQIAKLPSLRALWKIDNAKRAPSLNIVEANKTLDASEIRRHVYTAFM